MNPKEKLEAIQLDLTTIYETAKTEGRDFTDAEARTIEQKSAEALALKAHIAKAEKSQAVLDSIGRLNGNDYEPTGTGVSFGAPKMFFPVGGKGGLNAGRQMAAQVRELGVKAFSAAGTVQTDVQFMPDPVAQGRLGSLLVAALPVLQLNVPRWSYLRQTTRTNSAAIVAPGAQKPTSTVTNTRIDSEALVFAHISEYVDEYLLADNDTLASFLAGELQQMLVEKVEGELLNGDGSTGHLTGLLHTSGIQSQGFVGDAVTSIRYALGAQATAGYGIDPVVVLNPDDWTSIETRRIATGAFDLSGGPVDVNAAKLWGTPVVLSAQVE